MRSWAEVGVADGLEVRVEFPPVLEADGVGAVHASLEAIMQYWYSFFGAQLCELVLSDGFLKPCG